MCVWLRFQFYRHFGFNQETVDAFAEERCVTRVCDFCFVCGFNRIKCVADDAKDPLNTITTHNLRPKPKEFILMAHRMPHIKRTNERVNTEPHIISQSLSIWFLALYHHRRHQWYDNIAQHPMYAQQKQQQLLLQSGQISNESERF